MSFAMSSRIASNEASPTCDACAAFLPVTRAAARVMRRFFGTLHCPACDPNFTYEDAWDELLGEVRAATEDDYGARTERGETVI